MERWSARQRAVWPLLLAVLGVLLLIGPAGPVMASSLPPSDPLGQLQVTVTNLPSLIPPDVTISGPLHLTVPVLHTLTLPLPVGQYTVSAKPERVGTRQYFPTVTPASVTVTAGRTATVTVDYLTIVPDTTKILSSMTLTTLVSASSGYATLTFTQSAALPPLAPGDILVAGVSPQTPYGFLRTVTGVSIQGTQMVVTTSPATLFDAAPRGSFDVQATLTANDVQGAVIRAAMQGATKSAGAPLLENIKQNLSCDAGGTAEVDGSISVVPSFHFAPTWGLIPPAVTQVTFTGTVTETAALTASASASAHCTLEKTPLLAKPIQFTPIEVTVGVVPVVIVPTLQFYLSADGHVELSITAGATQQATVTAGVDYANGAFTPIGQFTNSFSDSLPVVPALNGTVQGSVGPALDLLFYDVAGPTMNVDGSMQFTVTPDKTPWCQLSAGLDAGAGLVIPILDLDYSDPSIFSHTFPLARCNTPLPTGSITVAQQVVGPAPSSNWTVSGDLGRFTLPSAGGSTAFKGLIAGSYAFMETAQPGYTLATSCSNGAAGTNSVTVTLTTGQTVLCTVTASSKTLLPTVTAVSPSSGTAAGGTSVTITGANFTGATAVLFGSAAASSFTVNSDTSITAFSPVEAAGKVEVQVTTSSGSSALNPAADQFIFTASGTWATVAPLPTPRLGLAAATGLDGTIYAIGGCCDSTGSYTSSVLAYTPGTNSWASVAPLPMAVTYLGATGGKDGRIYTIGGTSGAGGFLDVADVYDPSANTWTPLPAPPATGERVVAATGANGWIYALVPNNQPDQSVTVEVYKPEANTWTTLPSISSGSGFAGAAGPDGRIYAMGGCCTYQDNYFNALVAYIPSLNGWTSRLALMPTARAFLAAAKGADGRIYALGGCGNYSCTQFLNTVEAYDTVTDTWATATPMPTARFDLAATAGSDGRIYAIGGQTPGGYPSALNTVEVYTP